jgi:hypothetical protein
VLALVGWWAIRLPTPAVGADQGRPPENANEEDGEEDLRPADLADENDS